MGLWVWLWIGLDAMAEQSYKSHRMYCDDPLYSDIEDAAGEDKSVSKWLREAAKLKLEAEE